MEKERTGSPAEQPKASTESVLGASFGESNVDPKWEKHYRVLTRLRSSLLGQRRDLVAQAAEENTPPQRNLAELGTDHYDRDWALSMASSEQELLYEIEEALNRIKNGRYGICEATGQPIAPERLRAVPWTRFSAEAERDLEARGQVRRPHLGQLQEVPKETSGNASQDND